MKKKYIITESQLKILESKNELLYHNQINDIVGSTVKFLYVCDEITHQEKIIVRIMMVDHRVWKSPNGGVYDNILLTLERALVKSSEPFKLRFVYVDKPYFENIGDDCYYFNEKLSQYLINYLNNRPKFDPEEIETDF
jgi:hypothetical protein